MSDEVSRLEITLRLLPAAEPIAGSAQDGSGPPLEYVGWLELMAAVESLRSGGVPGDVA